jgi:branched-chain amino acid transport system substrate-binding protein
MYCEQFDRYFKQKGSVMDGAIRSRHRVVCVLLAIMCVALALAACGAPGAGSGTIEIGAVVPLTGRYAAGGEQIKNGYELAVDAINSAGGVTVGGTKMQLKLTILDDASDPAKTVQSLETLYSSNNVVAYLGGFGSDLHAAAAGIAEKNKVPYLGVAFALKKVHDQGFKYLFSPFPKSPDLAVATFDMLDTLSPKPSKVAILPEKTDWGAELDALWKEQAEKRGYSVVADQEYAPGSKDFSPVVLAAKNAGAEVVLALPNPPDGLALAKQMKELDFNANVYVFIRAADALSWSQGLGKDGDYFLNMPGWNPAVNFPGVSKMVQDHQTKYNKPAQATTGPAYAAVQILADAIGRAGSVDRDKIRDAIAATDMMTVVGPVKFNADGTGQVITVINQWQDGKQVLVWPADQTSIKVAYPAKPWKER